MPEIRLAPKPPPGPLAARLRACSDRCAEKAAIHCEAPIPEPFIYQGIEITVLRRECCVIEKVGRRIHGLEVRVEARRGGQLLPIDGHLRFFNPPTMVPDGTHREEAIEGLTVTFANHREDARAALIEIVGQAVVGQPGARP